MEQFGKRNRKKIVVFKQAQEAQIDAYTEPKPKSFFGSAFRLVYLQAREIIQKRREQQQEEKSPIPASIKHIAGQQ